MSREIRLLQIIAWLCSANGMAFVVLELVLGQSFNAFISVLPVFVGLSVLTLINFNKLEAASIFLRIGLLSLFYIFDTGFELNTGSYLFYVPFIIVTYLYESYGFSRTKTFGLIGIVSVVLLVNLFESPKLAGGFITDRVPKEVLFYINLGFSFFTSVLVLQFFSNARKRVANDLLHNQANYRALVENTDDQIWSIDTRFKLLSFNNNYKKAFESFWKKEPFLGMNLMSNDGLNPQVFTYWSDLYERAISGERFREEQVYEYAGSKHFLEFSFVPVFSNNKVESIVITATDISAIRNREEELKVFAQSLNLLLSSTGDIIFELDESSFCIRVWHAPEVELVDSIDNFIGKSLKELFDIPFNIRLSDQFDQVLKTKQSRIYEYSHDFKGSLKYYSCKIRIINNTEPIRLAVVLEDITSRKEIELRQAKQSVFLNKLIDHIPLGIYVKNVNENYAYTLWNRELEIMFDLPQSKVIGKTDAHIFNSDGEIKQYISTDKMVAESAEPILINKLNINFGANKIVARNFKIPILGSNGKVELIIGILENISDIVQTQQNLELAEKRWQYALSGSRDVVWDVNIITGEIYYSPLFKIMLGYQEEENPVLVWEELIHPDDFRNTWLSYQQHMKGQSQYFEAEYRFKKRDGSYLWVLDRGRVAERSEKGEALRVIGTFHDITYKKSLEEQLIKAKEKAEEVSKAKGLFLSTMSHEIRTPMNAVNGIIRLLIQDDPLSHQLENLQALQFSSEQLMFLLNDILDFSKIDAGKLERDERNFKPLELFTSIVQTMGSQLEDKPVKLQLNFDSEMPEFLLGDRHRLGQVLSNLLSNAIKFTEEGGVDVKVKFNQLSESDYLLYCEIVDTGIGIQEDKLPYIFELFTQATNETTRKFGGTGLGLAISKKLIEWLGGNLSVESKLGIGTRFWFEIPIKRGKDDFAEIRNELDQKLTFSPLKNFQILIVEDNKMNVFVLERFMKKWEANYMVAENGLEAVEIVKNNHFDLILMDLQMPEMDGIEATKQIREMGYKMPIFALTANVFSDVKEKVLESGMNDYISKPFNPNELYSKLQTHFKSKDNSSSKLTLF
jgi:PAS domain S-box-containing protein